MSSSRWRERKGTFVSAGELQARRKALLVPVQKYRQAWVQVSLNSTYKVLKWIPRPTNPPGHSSSRAAETDQPPLPRFIEDPNTIDGSSDEDEEMEDDDEGSSGPMDERSAVPESPTSSFTLGRKASRAVAATEGAGGQLAGLETGEIAEQVELEEAEEEEEERSQLEHPSRVVPRLVAQSGSESSSLPPVVQLVEEVQVKDIEMDGELYDDVVEDCDGVRPSGNEQEADVTMHSGNEIKEPTIPWIETDPPPATPPVHEQILTNPPSAYALPGVPPTVTDETLLPFTAPEVQELDIARTSQDSDDAHQPNPKPELSQPPTFSKMTQVQNVLTTEPDGQSSQSQSSSPANSRTMLASQPAADQNPIQFGDSGLDTAHGALAELPPVSSMPPANAETNVTGLPSVLPTSIPDVLAAAPLTEESL